MDNIDRISEKESIDNSNIKTQIAKESIEDYILTEKDFYPPEDIRVYQSGIYDIVDGDNFQDYVVDFYKEYENEIFDT